MLDIVHRFDPSRRMRWKHPMGRKGIAFSRRVARYAELTALEGPRMIDSLRMLIPPRFPDASRLVVIAVVIAAYTAVVAALDYRYHPTAVSNWDWALSLVNALILGSLVTFRTNEAKRRWWEGRSLWGQLINETRNLSIKSHALLHLNEQDRARWSAFLQAFPEALRLHLRGMARLQDVPGMADMTDEPVHVPLYLAGRIQAQLVAWRREGRLDDMGLWLLDRHARELMNVCGGCEKIRNTPVPLSYRALIHRGIALNILVTPLFLVQDAGFWSILIMAVTAYFVFGVELAAVHIEEPFGLDADDLPLESYCEAIERSVEQVYGDDAPNSHGARHAGASGKLHQE